ncbi:ATPase family associated with various cellular activities (AAA) [Methylobacterium sp. 174MFSha1.1]|uniref:AAA family ATPase n=1 Tax=Methylobacterium sp. 174MFSha1.1 TaxID=1502749 RepID=UPI0008F08F18|nr:AAA family ATPase [Methylobacterium sp. 174MFSha1.1]SFV16818.1 ATPase family associated with various cellular activities (AAA) [Methylobacterium sp. 174MFSha1.1]
MADEDGFDRPGLPEILGRLAYYALALGLREARQYAHDYAIELARMSLPGDATHYVAHGLSLLTPLHPCFLASELSQCGLCLAMSHALALGLEHLPGIMPAAASLDVEEENEDCEGIVCWRRNPPPARPRPRAEPAAKVAAADPDRVAKPGHVIVLRRIGEVGRSDMRRDIERTVEPILNKDITLVAVPDDRRPIVGRILARLPHMHVAAKAMVTYAARGHWGWDPVILWGDPGTAKTEYVRLLGQETGRPVFRFNADAAQDASFGSTSSRYSTAHPSYPLASLLRSSVASIICHVDELDKAGGSRDNNTGRLTDALTSMLEKSTASAWYDSYVQAPIDLSPVQFIITVNDINRIPHVLQDRCRIIPVGTPLPEHLPILAPQFARAACRDLGLDEAWGVFDDVEYRALEEAWGQGGSLRTLQKLCRTILQARDLAPGISRH